MRREIKLENYVIGALQKVINVAVEFSSAKKGIIYSYCDIYTPARGSSSRFVLK